MVDSRWFVLLADDSRDVRPIQRVRHIRYHGSELVSDEKDESDDNRDSDKLVSHGVPSPVLRFPVSFPTFNVRWAMVDGH